MILICVILFLVLKTGGTTSESEIALTLTIHEAFKCSNSPKASLPFMALSPARLIQMAAILKKLIKDPGCTNDENKDNFDIDYPSTWNFCALGSCARNTCSCYNFIQGSRCHVFTGDCWLLYCFLKYCNDPLQTERLECQCNPTYYNVNPTSGIYWYDEGLETLFRPREEAFTQESSAHYVFVVNDYKNAVNEAAHKYAGTITLMHLLKKLYGSTYPPEIKIQTIKRKLIDFSKNAFNNDDSLPIKRNEFKSDKSIDGVFGPSESFNLGDLYIRDHSEKGSDAILPEKPIFPEEFQKEEAHSNFENLGKIKDAKISGKLNFETTEENGFPLGFSSGITTEKPIYNTGTWSRQINAYVPPSKPEIIRNANNRSKVITYEISIPEIVETSSPSFDTNKALYENALAEREYNYGMPITSSYSKVRSEEERRNEYDDLSEIMNEKFVSENANKISCFRVIVMANFFLIIKIFFT